MSWRETFRRPADLAELEGARGSGSRRGQLGIAMFFPGGWYPACSLHGAMNRLGARQPAVWRCLAEGCNVGTRCVVMNPVALARIDGEGASS